MSVLKHERRGKAIRDQVEIAEAALSNELLTRRRVEALETHADKVARLIGRGIWGRLKWLVLGR